MKIFKKLLNFLTYPTKRLKELKQIERDLNYWSQKQMEAIQNIAPSAKNGEWDESMAWRLKLEHANRMYIEKVIIPLYGKEED